MRSGIYASHRGNREGEKTLVLLNFFCSLPIEKFWIYVILWLHVVQSFIKWLKVVNLALKKE